MATTEKRVAKEKRIGEITNTSWKETGEYEKNTNRVRSLPTLTHSFNFTQGTRSLALAPIFVLVRNIYFRYRDRSGGGDRRYTREKGKKE